MYQRKESAKNTYYPSFLCMEVDTPDYPGCIDADAV